MINKDGTIKPKATIAGQEYQVIQTKRGASSSVWDARDEIRNLTTGNKKEMTRREWKQLFSRF